MDIRKESLKKHYEWQGKIEVISRAPINSREELSLAYTPGVAEPCLEINKDIDKKIFDNADFHINDNAANADETIRYYRYEKLSDERMEATYKFVDSILDDAKINLDKITSTLSSMIEDDIPIGCINLKISDFANYNIGNGYMFGLGIGTNNRLSKVFSIEGFGDYWFKAKEFNYGGNVTFNIMRSLKMKIQLGAYHKFERLGNYGFRENKNMLNSDNFKHFYTKSTSLNNSIYVDYSTYLNKFHDSDKKPNPIAAAMSWVKVNVKMLQGNKDEQIADLMTDGCDMGIKSIARYLNKYPAALPEVKELAADVIKLEENFELDLRRFL